MSSSPTERRHPERHRRFSTMRLWMSVATESTRLVEIGLAVAFFLFRGLYLVSWEAQYDEIEAFLGTIYLNEGRIGVLCIVAALIHLYAAGTDRPGLRAWAAAYGMLLAMTVAVAFIGASPETHPIGVVWLSVIIGEFYILIRHFITLIEARVGP